MRIRTTIFDSGSEHELFDALKGTWEPRFRLYPHVPYANLIDLDPQRVSAAELSFLHRTTVDFVLTDGVGTPLLGIEFDGLGHGLSRHGAYESQRPVARDPHREWKLGLKAKIAEECCLPFVIVSYDEKATVDEDAGLMIAHGIVGAVLSLREIRKRLPEVAQQIQEEDPTLTEAEFTDRVQDALIGIEIDADMEHNPIVRRATELETLLSERYPEALVSWSFREEPERPDNADPWVAGFSADALAKWWNDVRRWGVEVTIQTATRSQTTLTWVRNFESHSVGVFGWLDELGKLIAITSFLRGEIAEEPLKPAS